LSCHFKAHVAVPVIGSSALNEPICAFYFCFEYTAKDAYLYRNFNWLFCLWSFSVQGTRRC